MVKLNNAFEGNQSAGFQQANNSQAQSQFSSPAQQQASFNENQSQPASQPKGLFQIPPSLLQWIPLIPFVLEQATGQKIPAMGGTIGEIQVSLQQIQFSLSQLFNSQQQIFARLESLENNASSQLTNLSQQVASTNKSFHLLATETKRSLEFNPRPQLENHYQEPN